ncbi:sulfatase-like hydrolase/transferase [Halobellus clavatus]|uniref:Sulfatase n=1 Tax=Halobellus clavatus TaxID=660517 RepID=A0A1H3G679_9EURY|nr:sulfatase-like hydrolase/transferase [Halobellus clavatus]SDX98771.1 Sulfatase [Halobellus clavatus]
MTNTPNIVILVLDTARFDIVNTKINSNITTPNLSRLAKNGVTFDNCYAPAPWTLPSHASLFTGIYPSKHGAHAGNKYLNSKYSTIAEIFHQNGYKTAAASNNTWINDKFGFGQGFDTFFKGWKYFQSGVDVSQVSAKNRGFKKYALIAREVLRGNPIKNGINALFNKYHSNNMNDDDGAKRTTEWLKHWIPTRKRRIRSRINARRPAILAVRCD